MREMMSKSGPNPDWKPGDPFRSPVEEMISLDPGEIGQVSTYKLMIGAIVPRPIAFVSTVDPNGVVNLAPFSFFNGISSNPPCLVLAITRKSSGEKKDTLRNIEATRELVVNTAAEWIAEPMNWCSAEYPHGISEMEKVGLTPIPSKLVKPPRVKESPVQMECDLHDLVQVGDGSAGSSTLVIARIRMIHIHKPAYADGKVLLRELHPIARLGGADYARINDVFSLPRPSVKP